MSGSQSGEQTMRADVNAAVRTMERQTERQIVEIWLYALRGLPDDEKFVLLLDNYDVYQDRVGLDDAAALWNTLERARQILPNLRTCLASREPIRHQERLDALKRGLNGLPLPDLSPKDSAALLQALGVSAPAFADAVHRLTQGHPLLTRMAAEAWRETPGGISADHVPALTKREEAANWLQTQIFKRMASDELREAASWALVLRWFSFEMLEALLETPLSKPQYDQLTAYSFFVPSKINEGYKAGHDLIRKVHLETMRREQPGMLQDFHAHARGYFAEREDPTLERLYHGFFAAPEETFEAWKKLEGQAAFSFHHLLWGRAMELALREELNLPAAYQAEIIFRDGRRHYYLAEWAFAEKKLHRSPAPVQGNPLMNRPLKPTLEPLGGAGSRHPAQMANGRESARNTKLRPSGKCSTTNRAG